MYLQQQVLIVQRFQVLMVVSINMTSFRGMALWGVIEVDHHFRDMYCLHHQGVK
jgi:hypothetical protein